MAAAEFDGQPVLARITITRVMTDNDIVDHVQAEATDGTRLGFAEALGMLELAKWTLADSFAEDDEDVEP